MQKRRLSRLGTLVLAGFAAWALLGSCGFQKFPEDMTIDTVPPEPPTNLTATGSDQTLDLSWEASVSGDVEGYLFYYREDASTEFEDPVWVGDATSYQLTGLTNGIQYRIRVRARDQFGNLSEPPEAAEITASTIPMAPSNLTTDITHDGTELKIDLSWTPPTESDTITGYYVRVSDDGGSTWSNNIDAGNEETLILDASTYQTLEYSTTYDIDVRAYDEENNRSLPLTGQVTTPPEPPVIIPAIPGDATVYLFWNWTGTATLAGFDLWVSPPNDSNWYTATDDDGDVTDLQATVTTYDLAGTSTSLVNGDQYRFRIRARDGAGRLSIPADAAEVSVTPTNVPPEKPGIVRDLSAEGANREILVQWLPPADPGSGVSQYELSWNNTGSETNFPNTVYVPNVAASPPPPNPEGYIRYTLENGAAYTIQNGVEYTIRVRAVGPTTSVLSDPVIVRATPGADNVIVDFKYEGGAYRWVGVGDENVPNDLVLTGKVDKTVPDGTSGYGVIYYTVDESNPAITASAADGSAVTLDPSSTGTFYQANTATGIANAIDLEPFAIAGEDYVIVKALFDPDGTAGTTTPTGDEGVTVSMTYFILQGFAQNRFAPFGGMLEWRRFHSASLVEDGNQNEFVFVHGGYNAGAGTIQQNAENFRENIEFFYRNAAVPAVPRMEHVAVTLDSGEVLLVGGREALSPYLQPSDLSLQAERYDPTTGGYTPFAGPDVFLHDAVRLSSRDNQTEDNLVLVCGGWGNLTTVGPAPSAAMGESTASEVHTADIDVSLVSIGDVVAIVDGLAAGETAMVVNATVDSTTGYTVIHLDKPLSAEPDNASFYLYHPTLSGWSIYDPATDLFTTNTDMPDNRFGHRATLLQDGRVLVTGGYYPPSSSSTNRRDDTALLYDPGLGASGTWSRAGGNQAPYTTNAALMQDDRFFHTATVLKDGRVLVAGGLQNGSSAINRYFPGNTIFSHCDLFDAEGRQPSEIVCRATGDLGTGRFYHTATLLQDGKVLLCGGVDYIDSTTGSIDYTASAELFDPASETFSDTGSMLEPRYGHRATLLDDGRVLITGGLDSFLPEIYDPATGKFSATAGTLTGNHYFESVATRLNDDRILVTGGQRPNKYDRSDDQFKEGPILDTLETRQENTSLFTSLETALSTPRKKHSATVLDDGRVFIAGGLGGDGDTPVPLTTTDLYDPRTDTATAGPTISPRFGHVALKLPGERFITEGTADFDDTANTVTFTGLSFDLRGPDATANTADDVVLPGDRIRADNDPNLAFFEISAVTAADTLSIRAGGGAMTTGAYPVPDGPDTYTLRITRPYTEGTADFANGSSTVTGTGTVWGTFLTAGNVIRPTGIGVEDYYVILSVDSDTQLTLTRAYDDASVTASAYEAKGNAKVLLLGGGTSGSPLNTADVFDPDTNQVTGTTNSMTLGRYEHTATLLACGWVLIVGGNNNFDRTAELFDPAVERFYFLTGTPTYSARNNHTAFALPYNHATLSTEDVVFIAGGEVDQNGCEVFFPDVDNDDRVEHAIHGAPWGIAGLDLDGNAFRSFPDTLTDARVEHTVSFIPGATDRLLFVGSVRSSGSVTAEYLSWNDPSDPTNAANTFSASIPLARTPMMSHMAAYRDGNGNVLVIRGHTVQVFFSD